MPQITVGRETYHRLREMARGAGFDSLPAFLDSLVSEPERFQATSEIETVPDKAPEDKPRRPYRKRAYAPRKRRVDVTPTP